MLPLTVDNYSLSYTFHTRLLNCEKTYKMNPKTVIAFFLFYETLLDLQLLTKEISCDIGLRHFE